MSEVASVVSICDELLSELRKSNGGALHGWAKRHSFSFVAYERHSQSIAESEIELVHSLCLLKLVLFNYTKEFSIPFKDNFEISGNFLRNSSS